jgi:hypothetical protein
MNTVSLDNLRDKEHNLFDHVHDDSAGLSYGTPTDKFMEINYGRMGEDSEKTALRKNRADKVLQRRSIPSYQPHGEGV